MQDAKMHNIIRTCKVAGVQTNLETYCRDPNNMLNPTTDVARNKLIDRVMKALEKTGRYGYNVDGRLILPSPRTSLKFQGRGGVTFTLYYMGNGGHGFKRRYGILINNGTQLLPIYHIYSYMDEPRETVVYEYDYLRHLTLTDNGRYRADCPYLDALSEIEPFVPGKQYSHGGESSKNKMHNVKSGLTKSTNKRTAVRGGQRGTAEVPGCANASHGPKGRERKT